MTFHHVFNNIFNSEIVTVEELKRYCFAFVPDLYQVPKSQVQVQVQVLITPDQVQPKYWSMDSEW